MLMDNFKFSIIVAVYNSSKYLDETISSVINQDIGFEDNVQLILVNDGSTDNSLEIMQKYQSDFPNNIIALSKDNGGPASARNLGLKYATGDFINFLDGDDMLKLNSLSRVNYFFSIHEDIDLVSIPLVFFDRYEGDHHLNYKYERERVVDLKKEYNYPQLSSSSSFIKKEAISNHFFNENLINGEDMRLINEILLEKQKYGLLNTTEYKYRKRHDSSSFMDNPFSSKRAYTEKMELCYKHLIDYSIRKYAYVPKFIQYVIALDLNGIISSNFFEEIITDEDELFEFWDCLNYVMKYIDEDIIKNHDYLTNEYKKFYMFIKNQESNIIISSKNKVFLKSKNFVIDRLHSDKLLLDIIEIKNGFLNISGYFSSKFNLDYINIEAIIKTPDNTKKIYPCKKVQYPTTTRKIKKYLGIEWKFFNNFDLKVPINEFENFKVSFRYIFKKDDEEVIIKPKLAFRDYANLSLVSNYFVKDSKIVLFKDNALHVVDYSSKFRIKLELSSLLNIIRSKEENKFSGLLFRLLYYIFYNHYKNKRIWLFMDRPSSAEDNARCLFEYAVNQDDDIENYFIVDKKSEDYKNLKKISKHVVNYRSIKHKLLYLFSEKIISSHVDDFWLNPFFDSNRRLFSGLSTIETCFLQHGVTKDDISNWIRKYYNNLFLFVTASDYERDSILKDNYNYSDDVVKTLGFARFDNLTNEKVKKQILFIPTWRNYLKTDGDFCNSDYFKTLNSLLNNEHLLNLLKQKGFKLVFKPHSNLIKFMDNFNLSDQIEISDDTFQNLINESSLIISDYSSVTFDFAYLKKPVIYYQPNDDYHYDEGYFDYETMGFGPIIKSEHELERIIIEYIEKDCTMEEKYEHRVNVFFKYNDKNNCNRIYNWLYENK